MSFKDNVAAMLTAREQLNAAKRCIVARARDLLATEEDRTAFDRVLSDHEGFSGKDVADLLRGEGQDVSPSSVTGHRAGRCGCAR
jgi:hypothetical protein